MRAIAKKKLLIVSAIFLSLVLLGTAVVGVDHLFLRGRAYEADGIRQNTHLYAESIAIQNGVLSYTLVNDTFHSVQMTTKLNFEKKVGDEWQAVIWRGPLLAMRGTFDLQARSRTERSVQLKNILGEAYAVGEYRLIHGDLGIDSSSYDENTGEGAFYHIYSSKKSYIVGYFSVTAEML